MVHSCSQEIENKAGGVISQFTFGIEIQYFWQGYYGDTTKKSITDLRGWGRQVLQAARIEARAGRCRREGMFALFSSV